MINRYHQIPIWSHKTWYYQSHSTFKVNAGVPYITESHGSQLPRISGTLVTIGKSLVGGLLMVIIHITIWWYMLYQLLISLTIIYIYTYIYICIYILLYDINIWLVVSTYHSEKSWTTRQLGPDDIPNFSGKSYSSHVPVTTNQSVHVLSVNPMGILDSSPLEKNRSALRNSQQKSPFQSEIRPDLRWLKMTYPLVI